MPTRPKYLFMIIIFVGVMFAATATLFTLSELRYRLESHTLQATIEKTEVVNLRPTKSLLKTSRNIVSYDFQIPGENTRRRGRSDISQHLFDKLKSGDLIELQVIKSQPSLNRPIDPSPWSAFFIFAFGLIGFCLIHFGLKNLRKKV